MTDRAPRCNCPLPYRAQVPEVHEESCPVVADRTDRDSVVYRLRSLAERFYLGIDCAPAEPIIIRDTHGAITEWHSLLIEAADLLANAPSLALPEAPREVDEGVTCPNCHFQGIDWQCPNCEVAGVSEKTLLATLSSTPQQNPAADLAPNWAEHPDGSVTIPASDEDIAAITSHQETRVRELEAVLTRIVDLEQIDDRGYPTANLADAVEIARGALRAKENVK